MSGILKNDMLKQNKSTIAKGDKVMNQIFRRHWLKAALIGTAIAFAGSVQAQNYPSKPIRLVVQVHLLLFRNLKFYPAGFLFCFGLKNKLCGNEIKRCKPYRFENGDGLIIVSPSSCGS